MRLCDRGGKGSPDLRRIAATFAPGRNRRFVSAPITAPTGRSAAKRK
jgi:hypothetical protein